MVSMELLIGGLPVRMTLHHCSTRRYFERFILDKGEAESFPPERWLNLPPVDAAALAREQERLHSDPSFAEYSLLIELFGNPILRFGRFLFHGAAFKWHNKALILTGRSGVGKTTQLHHWFSQFGDEISLISGDKALIEIRDDGFLVHPSPWTGKEGEQGLASAPLGGIVLLEQGQSNSICRLPVNEAVFPLFLQFLYRPVDVESVNLVCGYEERLLSSVPVWKLVNLGDPDSAALCHDYLLKEVE